MIAAPTLREVLDWLRELDHPLPDDAEQRWSRAIGDHQTGPPVWLDAMLFVGAWLVVGLIACGCFPIWAVPGAPIVVGALAFITATVARWTLPGTLGRMAAPALFAIALSARLVLLIGFAALNVDPVAGAAFSVGLEATALLVYPDRAHRALTTITLGVAMLALIQALDPNSIVQSVLSSTSTPLSTTATLTEQARDTLLALWLVLGAGLIVARPLYASTALRHALEPVSHGLAILGLAGLTRFWSGWADEGFIVWIGTGTGALALATAGVCLARVRAGPGSWVVALLGTTLVVALGLALPGLAASLAFVLLALLVRDTWLLIIAVLAVLCFGTWAYVVLELPVLVKGGALFGSGAVLLGLRAWMRWRIALVVA